MTEELALEPAPRKRGRPPKTVEATVSTADATVKVLRSAVHDGLGNKFYAGDTVTVDASIAEVWIERGWAERA